MNYPATREKSYILQNMPEANTLHTTIALNHLGNIKVIIIRSNNRFQNLF